MRNICGCVAASDEMTEFGGFILNCTGLIACASCTGFAMILFMYFVFKWEAIVSYGILLNIVITGLCAGNDKNIQQLFERGIIFPNETQFHGQVLLILHHF